MRGRGPTPSPPSKARAVNCRELGARITLARRVLQPQVADRKRIAALCVHDILEGWIIRLVLRGLGVTSVSVRSAEQIAGLGPVSVVAAPDDARGWPGLASADRALILIPDKACLGWEKAEIEPATAAGVTAPGRRWPGPWAVGSSSTRAPIRGSLAYPGLTHAVVTPYLLASLMAQPADAALRNDGFRLFVVGGVLSQSLWRAARERLTGIFTPFTE